MSWSPQFDALGMSTLAANALGRGGYRTCEEVAAATDAELRQIRWLGAGTLAEIRRHIPYRPPAADPIPNWVGEGTP